MERQLVSHEKPVAILTGVFPEYSREGIAVDCGHVILCRQGSARMTLNFRELRQEKDVMVILYPGDVVMVQDLSDDFAIEYLVVTDDIMTEAQLELSQADAIRNHQHISSHEIAALADALLTVTSASIHYGNAKDARDIGILQLRSFMIAYGCWLERHGHISGRYASRSAELFARFMHLLTRYYRDNRQVAFYAEKINITPKYLNGIILKQTGKTAKAAIDDYVVMQLKLTLQTSDRTVNEIAWQFNFSSLSFFCEYFRRHVGLSPVTYREQATGRFLKT